MGQAWKSKPPVDGHRHGTAAVGRAGNLNAANEGLQLAREKMNQKNVYYMNPSFDK